jgi:GNAT superfamily N-acetyltransferase
MHTSTIRPAAVDDAPTILALIRELAVYERMSVESIVTTEADLVRDGFGPSPAFQVLLAEDESGVVVGFALYFFTWSTWAGKRCVHLEDLFVKPSARGRGAGFRLMQAVARAALENGCARFNWQVLDWNKPAFDFYEKLDAIVMKEWISVRLEGSSLEKLAQTAATRP